MWSTVLEFSFGAILAHLIVRVPFLTFPRMKSWNEQFPPHPEAVYIDSHLIQRVMHMRIFYWVALIFALIPLVFGWFSLQYGSAPIGFGMWSFRVVDTFTINRSYFWRRGIMVQTVSHAFAIGQE